MAPQVPWIVLSQIIDRRKTTTGCKNVLLRSAKC